MTRALVLGSGIAGAAAALMLGRRGHDVVVLERDPAPRAFADANEAFEVWNRPGLAQFRQPHNFLGLGRRLLRERLPDVYEALLRAGATEVDQWRFITDGTSEPGDGDLATIACRRPVLDAALTAALEKAPNVERRHGARVAGLLVSAAQPATVLGVVLDGGEHVTGDLVVDALGRTSRASGWLDDSGAGGPPERSSECGLRYYSRHYRRRDDSPMPPYASLLAGPRGDLGYLAFALFVGDNRTYCLCIMTSADDRELAAVRRPDVFSRVAERLPGVDPWVDPGCAEPITPVLPMGRIHNLVRTYVPGGQPVVLGLQAIGDALCHTNPTFAFGASLALQHAAALADVLDEAADHDALARAMDARVGGDAARRYEAVSAEDRDRARLWGGEPLDVTDSEASMPLFLRSVVYRAATADSTLLRAVLRRINLLDDPDLLQQDTVLLRRAREIFETMRSAGELPRTPSRQELLAAITG